MPPRNNNSTNIPLNYEQNPKVLDMPNVSSVVTEELKRLQLEIISDITDLIDFDFENYKSVDYFPKPSDIIDDSPGSRTYSRQFNRVINDIRTKLRVAQEDRRKYLSYVKYFRKYFTVSYDNEGLPILKFTIPVSNNAIEELMISNVARYPRGLYLRQARAQRGEA